MGIIFSYIIPAWISYLLGTTISEAFLHQVLRHVVVCHILGLSNSYAHYYGTHPFDR